MQSALQGLTTTDGLVAKHWQSAPNRWIRLLPNKKVGIVGELLVVFVLGGERKTNNSLGYDVERGEEKIEVKTSTRSFSVNNCFTWNQVRKADPCTHVCFIAVYPDNVRMFNVPKASIPESAMLKQHGKNGDGVTSQIKVNHPTAFPKWLTEHEVKPTATAG